MASSVDHKGVLANMMSTILTIIIMGMLLQGVMSVIDSVLDTERELNVEVDSSSWIEPQPNLGLSLRSDQQRQRWRRRVRLRGKHRNLTNG